MLIWVTHQQKYSYASYLSSVKLGSNAFGYI
jgi:hypothetical protein